jgi:hypothetical protein
VREGRGLKGPCTPGAARLSGQEIEKQHNQESDRKCTFHLLLTPTPSSAFSLPMGTK